MAVLSIDAMRGCGVTGRALELRSEEHKWGQSHVTVRSAAGPGVLVILGVSSGDFLGLDSSGASFHQGARRQAAADKDEVP